MKYYKFLSVSNVSQYQNFDYTDYLPKDGKPGKWLPKIDRVEICDSGYHAFESKDILSWYNAQLYEIEYKGKIVSGEDKVAGHQMRFVRKIDGWNENTARKFACYCAYDILPIYEKYYPNDSRPRKAIEVAELYADGKATKEELAAARDAAWAAVAAARAASRAAAWAALDAAGAAAGAADWAALDAAGAAAGAAASDAASDAAMKKYTNKLLEMVGIEEEK